MRGRTGQPAGLLLVEVLRERPAHVVERRRDAERPREQHREVAHVHEVLVPEVHEELLARRAPAA